MGLDVYLYKYQDKQDSDKREKKYSEYSESIWVKDYDSYTDEEKNSLRAKEKVLADELNLDQYGDDKTGKECIEINSTKYPEHYFKIGYFRSSYNEGGINSILRNLGVPDLYDIMKPNEDEYCFQPDWQECLTRVKRAIKTLKGKGNYRIEKFSANEFVNPNELEATDTKSAMQVFLKEIEKDTMSKAYSNGSGLFFRKDPAKVLAVIHGTSKMLLTDHILPCAYIVYEGENEWYTQALEIVQETIEYVLAQPDKNKYYLHWSS